MMRVTIDKKSQKVLFDIGKHGFKHRKALRIALNEIGSKVSNKMANFIFRPPKTGRFYVYKGRRYQASAPGESPANRTGRLAGSGGYRVRSYFDVTIFETAPYAKYLEYGTPKMLPRPHLSRAVNTTRAFAIRTIENCLNRELKR